ncbi:hypothetical protein V5O48_011545 [Marasmius crinis-equi]|uniref:CNNM transmembrane domain-containing protein n=1 Tax=Marasmius crinis-equi TaxID=585013 RepID=A0ABR3F589_9AGAR
MSLAKRLWLIFAISKPAVSLPLTAQSISTLEDFKGSIISRWFQLLLLSPNSPPGYHDVEFWCKILISVGLVLLAGVFAGLTLALMGLDSLHLRVLSVSSESVKERRNAQKVIKLLRKGRHWVLVVLLLSNVIINETLPVFLDTAIGGGIAAVAISTVAIVIFGIIPQAVGIRHGLSIGAACAPFVSSLMWIMYPIAYPIAKLLDRVVGVHESHTYRKTELKSLLELHRTGEEPLEDDEITILTGVLDLRSKRIEKIMTPLKARAISCFFTDVATLSSDTVLDQKKLDELLASGYSRFPVHAPGEPLTFVGLLLLKKLLRFDLSNGLPISNALSILPEASPNITCFQALNYFRTGRSHLLLISRTPGQPGGGVGVVTLEDVIEEMILEEIVDETDRYEDNVSKRKARRSTTLDVLDGIVENLEIHDSVSSPATESDTTLVGKPLDLAVSESNAEDDRLLLPDLESSESTTRRIESWRKNSHSERTRPPLGLRVSNAV